MAESLMRPLLVCESVSPGSSRHDRFTKRRSLQRNAVPEYWIIDGDAQALEIWRPTDERPALIDDRLVWAPSDAIEAFELNLRDFFASAEDDRTAAIALSTLTRRLRVQAERHGFGLRRSSASRACVSFALSWSALSRWPTAVAVSCAASSAAAAWRSAKPDLGDISMLNL